MDSVSCFYSWSISESNCETFTVARIFIVITFVRWTISLNEKIIVLNKSEENSAAQKDLAEIYGVSVANVSRILTNKAKLHLLVETTQNFQWDRKWSVKAPDVDKALFR